MSARLILGTYPTPIEKLDELGLWIKRDDLAAPIYGGNKVRKLERLLGAAHAAGKTRLLTVGAAGSHQVVATAVYGRREGFDVEAVLVPQPSNEHAQRNLRVAIAQGLKPLVVPSWPAASAVIATRVRRDTHVIPLGGSNALSSLGFVDAARELAAQVAAGVMPEPEAVVVATGSGGTAAGLAVGFEALGMRTRIVGVAIAQPVPLLLAMARRVVRKTAELIGLSRARSEGALKRIDVDRRWLGRGYGWPTPAGDAAVEVAARAGGVVLDATYTAKAFACALSTVQGARPPAGPILYWHTLSTASMEPLLADAPALPRDLEELFR